MWLQDEMLRDQRYAEELEKLKTKEANEDEDGEGGGESSMDALNLLRRVFQLKRFVGGGGSAGEGGQAEEGAESPEEELVQAGCTAVVAVKVGTELYVANAGDSRGVLCRGGKAVALSEDHKPAQETERSRILAAGGFLSEIGGVCRVNGNLNLSRAIGDLKYKTNSELPAKDQIITAQPDIRKVSLQPEDRFFLLACDGVWDVMSNQDAVDFVSSRMDQGMTPTQVSCALLDACLASDPKEARGVGCDNMTVSLGAASCLPLH
jgi:protein phosphatase 1G